MRERILSARASRTFYNVADALLPSGPHGVGAGDVDLVPFVERWLRARGPGAARRLTLVLAALEWWPVLGLAARRGFSSEPLGTRQALLERWRRSRLRLRSEALAELETLVHEAMREHSKSASQPADSARQSEAGA